jgi:hypothetical protein
MRKLDLKTGTFRFQLTIEETDSERPGANPLCILFLGSW